MNTGFHSDGKRCIYALCLCNSIIYTKQREPCSHPIHRYGGLIGSGREVEVLSEVEKCCNHCISSLQLRPRDTTCGDSEQEEIGCKDFSGQQYKNYIDSGQKPVSIRNFSGIPTIKR